MKCLIGVPTLNGPERVFSFLRSLENFPPKIEYSVIVVDDGSSSVEASQLEEVCESFGVKLRCHQDDKGRPENRGVPAAWNTIIDRAIEKHISNVLIFNDDIQTLPRAIDSAVFALENNPGVGLVGIPPYHQRSTGLELRWPVLLHRGKPYRNYISVGCSFGLTLQTIETVGKFDERFRATFEDVDMSLRCIQANLMNITIPQGVIHEHAATFKTNKHLNASLRLELSRRVFAKKWGGPYESVIAGLTLPNEPVNYMDLEGNVVMDHLPSAET
ncbi:MAG: hypothetical protein UY48_C0003G0101 [Candidatus Gottesmanbacteria bacterium GW2011_GWB1_49_7]|uniref:Glycosyltransferase 2-like domain-containing protein n=1 Tax=Candidatus Gottesmanbacteria bacterium GW2011_GWB1_49_7 TaxID=1618448 RepID=A0A0G1Z3C3_9BACT|nr:MAG: hypothetical protein UY48_C0003G0101 [Candidatus Gottesmanbacteria bacterium GW2011_GWB1_49_7]